MAPWVTSQAMRWATGRLPLTRNWPPLAVRLHFHSQQSPDWSTLAQKRSTSLALSVAPRFLRGVAPARGGGGAGAAARPRVLILMAMRSPRLPPPAWGGLLCPRRDYRRASSPRARIHARAWSASGASRCPAVARGVSNSVGRSLL